MQYTSKFSGIQIDDAVQKVIDSAAGIPGCIKLPSTAASPINIDQHKVPGYFVVDHYTSSVEIPGKSNPLIFSVRVLASTGHIIQTIISAGTIYTRNLGLNPSYNGIKWSSDDVYSYIPLVATLPDPNLSTYRVGTIIGVISSLNQNPNLYLKMQDINDTINYIWCELIPRNVPNGFVTLDSTGKVPLNYLPNDVTGNIDGGLFAGDGPEAVLLEHLSSPTSHANLWVDGDTDEVSPSMATTLAGHLVDTLAHQNITIDGNMN